MREAFHSNRTNTNVISKVNVLGPNFFFPRTFLTAESFEVSIGLLDCFYTGQSPDVLTVFRAGQSPARAKAGGHWGVLGSLEG